MSEELISIIVPLYNKEENISRTINSILDLKYTNLELLIIDDGSTDNSASIIQSYIKDQRIKYTYKSNGGVSSARNLGINKANGKWIAFLDADDYFLPKALNILYETALNNKTLISTANFIVKKEQYESTFCCTKTQSVISNNYRAWFFRTMFPRTGAALFHKSILKEHMFDESLCRYEDAKSLFDIFRKHIISYSPEPVMVYSLDNTGLSRKANNINKDFIFGMDFTEKSFWEKIVLSELLIQGFNLYSEHKVLLKNKYKEYLYLVTITKILLIFRQVYYKI